MKFAISIISPPAYRHASVFQEVAETLHYGLLALGHDSVLTTQTDLPDRQHITLGANLLVHWVAPLTPNTVLYNFEQIYYGSPWLQPILLDHLLQFPVWDYSQANIAQLHEMGVAGVQYVPVGYVPELTRIPIVEPDIDVLFYGSLNERREAILQSLTEQGVQVKVVPVGVYGAERDALIARSKIVLNMHFYPAQVFEVVRVSYLLANRRFVISEHSQNGSEAEAFAPGVAFTEYDQLVDTCRAYLSRPQERQAIADVGFEIMRSRPEPDYLQPAIAQLLHQPPSIERFEPDLYRKRMAAEQLAQGHYGHAITLYEQSLEVDPTCAASYWNLGLALLLHGDELAAQMAWVAGISEGDEETRLAELLAFLQQSMRQAANPEVATSIQQQMAALGDG